MLKPSNIAASVVLVGFFVLSPHPVNAGCVSCGPGGECFEASAGFSANCECRVRVNHGTAICTPSGVCDPNDASSCPGNGPLPNLAPRGQISTKFVDRLADKNPLLAAAVFGVIEEHNSPCGKSPSLLASGKLTGTMRRDRKNYTFRATGQPLAQGALSFSIELEEDRTGRVQEFEGVVLENGRSGHIEQVGLKSRTSVFSWNAREEIPETH